MPKPRNVIPTQELHIKLRHDYLARVREEVKSQLEGRIPQGGLQAVFTEMIHERYSLKVLNLEPFGFPPGFFVKAPAEMLAELRKRLAA